MIRAPHLLRKIDLLLQRHEPGSVEFVPQAYATIVQSLIVASQSYLGVRPMFNHQFTLDAYPDLLHFLVGIEKLQADALQCLLGRHLWLK